MIVLLERQGSPLGEALARRLGARARRLDLDAPFVGEPVLVGNGGVHWQTCDLREAESVWVEEPLFAWPQSQAGAAESRASIAPPERRGARSLAISALFALGPDARVRNPVASFALAAEPLVALDRLRARGVAVHPWLLERRSANSPSGAGERVWLDLAGRCAGYVPSEPRDGDLAWSPEPASGELCECLVIGGAVAGAMRFDDLAAWARGERAERIAGERVASPFAALALATARALELDQASVTLVSSSGAEPSVVALAAGPDLALWDQRLEGAVARALTDLLDSSARTSSRTEHP